MPYVLFTSYQIIRTLISLLLQMVECLLRAQPVSVASRAKAHQSLIDRAVMWLATKSGWARSKCFAICSGKLCGGFIISSSAAPVVTIMLTMCSARELELEDRQSRLEAQLRERIASEGSKLWCWNLAVMLSVIPKIVYFFKFLA